ncbi:MAG: amino acid ABC transporter substrate-binding protein [Clostridiales bacterium]|nr:amino acid ABC transporter substrate-binding protein [Clostridiales bacterium]
MKKKTFAKVLSLALAALMLFALCACGAAETPAAEPTAAPAADAPASEAPAESQGVLDQIKADGVLYVTLSPDFAPMEFVDSSKDGQEQYVGFDVTLAKYIADYIGVDLVIEPMSFDACQTAVYTGSVPMSISGYSWTEERGENYEISDYYYAGDNETEQVILIKKTDADKYASAEDFSGVDVGAQNASLQMNLLTSQLPDANPITIGDLGVGVLELQNGSIEALAVAKGNAEMILDSNPDLMICPWEFEVAAEYEANVILITKGETALLNVVNEALAKAYADGLYGTWYEDAVALAKSENAAEVSVED